MDRNRRPLPRALGVVALLAGAVVALPSAAHAGGRSESGSVLVSTVSTAVAGSGAGPARCAWLTLGERSQGVHGHMVPLRHAEGDGRHRFRLTTRDPLAHFRVVFYGDLGECSGGAQQLRSYGPAADARDFGGEIPQGATHALVLLSSRVGSWWPCYMFPPLCFTPTYASPPGSTFTFTIEA